MSRFADELRATEVQAALRKAPAHVKGWEKHHELNGDDGVLFTGPLPERPSTWDAYLVDAGLDPEEVEVVEPVQVRGWDMMGGDGNVVRMHYYRITTRRRRPSGDAPDLVSLYRAAKKVRRRARVPLEEVESSTVVCYSDPQIGKVGSRGGTPELIERMDRLFGQVEEYLGDVKSDAAHLMEGGDIVESFENTPQQARTNDLDFPDQLDVAGQSLWVLMDLLAARRSRVVVASTTSNHCAWRRGKDNLSSPGADWGLFLNKQLQRACHRHPAFEHVSFARPNEWDESLALDVAGTVIGLHHGHQSARPEKILEWWDKQIVGGGATAHADILLTGHFHELRVQPHGRNPVTQRNRWWFQMPTVDNGSDWFRNKAGSDSEAGMLVFTVDANGWRDLEFFRG